MYRTIAMFISPIDLLLEMLTHILNKKITMIFSIKISQVELKRVKLSS